MMDNSKGGTPADRPENDTERPDDPAPDAAPQPVNTGAQEQPVDTGAQEQAGQDRADGGGYT